MFPLQLSTWILFINSLSNFISIILFLEVYCLFPILSLFSGTFPGVNIISITFYFNSMFIAFFMIFFIINL